MHMWQTHIMPEFVDEKTGKRIYHENEITLKIQQAIEKKFGTKGSFMHRDFDDDKPYDTKRAVVRKENQFQLKNPSLHFLTQNTNQME